MPPEATAAADADLSKNERQKLNDTIKQKQASIEELQRELVAAREGAAKSTLPIDDIVSHVQMRVTTLVSEALDAKADAIKASTALPTSTEFKTKVMSELGCNLTGDDFEECGTVEKLIMFLLLRLNKALRPAIQAMTAADADREEDDAPGPDKTLTPTTNPEVAKAVEELEGLSVGRANKVRAALGKDKNRLTPDVEEAIDYLDTHGGRKGSQLAVVLRMAMQI